MNKNKIILGLAIAVMAVNLLMMISRPFRFEHKAETNNSPGGSITSVGNTAHGFSNNNKEKVQAKDDTIKSGTVKFLNNSLAAPKPINLQKELDDIKSRLDAIEKRSFEKEGAK